VQTTVNREGFRSDALGKNVYSTERVRCSAHPIQQYRSNFALFSHQSKRPSCPIFSSGLSVVRRRPSFIRRQTAETGFRVPIAPTVVRSENEMDESLAHCRLKYGSDGHASERAEETWHVAKVDRSAKLPIDECERHPRSGNERRGGEIGK